MNKQYVVEQFPTPQLMLSAKAENFMVFTFIHKPDSVVDSATGHAYQEGWLAGLGLKPNPRLALVVIPKDIDLELGKKAYLEALLEIKIPSFQLQVPDLDLYEIVCDHKFGHYEGDKIEHCQVCGEPGGPAATEE